MQLRSWVFFSISILLSGCAVVSSSDVNPSTIYSQYSASYDEASSKVSFNASFFVGNELGTYVELDNKSSVTIDSLPMTEDKTVFNQVIYERDLWTGSQVFNESYTFSYTDDVGHIYQTAAQIPGRITFSTSPSGGVSIASGFSVGWSAQSGVGTGENVRATFESGNGSASQVSNSGGTGGQILFRPQDLQYLKPGLATLTLCRESYTSRIQGSPKGGSLTTRYCAVPVAMTLNP